MRKYLFAVFSIVFAGNLWAACELTEEMLTIGSAPGYDEYLYTNTKEYEMRAEGGIGKAYICGYGYCDVDDTIYLEDGAIGSNYGAEGVFVCRDRTEGGGRQNYAWVRLEIEQDCISTGQYRDNDTIKWEEEYGVMLYHLGDQYCKEVHDIYGMYKYFEDWISNNYETQDAEIKSLKESMKKLGESISTVEVKYVTKDEAIEIIEQQLKSYNIWTEENKNILIKFLKDTGWTNFIEGLEEAVKGLEEEINALNNRMNDFDRILTYLETEDINKNGQLKDIWEELGGLKGQIKTEEQFVEAVEEIISQSSLNETQMTEVVLVINQAISNLGLDSKFKNITDSINALNNRMNDFDRILTYLEEEDINKNGQLKDIWEELEGLKGQIKTEEEFVEAVEEIISQSSLNETQMTEVVFIINQAISNSGLDSKFKNISIDIEGIKEAIAYNNDMIDQLFQDLKMVDTNLNQEITKLQKSINGRPTVAQVNSLIQTALSSVTLNATQRAEVQKMIEEYAKSLSPEQKKEVELLIKTTVNPQFEALKQADATQNKQNISRDKVHSAMSVLNAFAAGQDASVWRNADGKFNTARLASDATAGVILGTAGGLISNKLIKKNQVKKGFEGIGCYVGGQTVAEFGDEFTVGIM